MKPTVTMLDWAVVDSPDASPYTAPEKRAVHLRGRVFGHPRRPEGDEVITSHIVSAAGRRVETRHTVYLLVGRPDPAYLLWCLANGVQPPDPEEPIRLVGPPGPEAWA